MKQKVELVGGPKDGDIWELTKLLEKLYIPIRISDGEVIEAIYIRTHERTHRNNVRYVYENDKTN